MTHRRRGLVGLALAMMLVPCGVLAQSPLDNDARLKTKLSADYLCIDLKSLCRLLSQKSLVIKPHKDCQDTKIQCRLTSRTRAEVMRLLAEWLPGTWEQLPNNVGYQLVRTGKATKQKREWWDTFLQVREAAYKAQADRMLAEMRVPPEQRPIEVIRPKNDPLADKLPPPTDPNVERAFFNLLPEEARQKLVSEQTNYQDYRKSTGMAGGMAAINTSAAFTMDVPDDIRQLLSREGRTVPADAQIRLRYADKNVHAMVISADNGLPLFTASLGGHFSPQWFDVATRLEDSLSRFVAVFGSELPTDCKRLLDWQKQTVWKNTLPDLKDAPQTVNALAAPSRAAALTELTHAPDTEFLADFYSTSGHDEEIPKERQTPPNEADWNRFAAQQDSSWKKAASAVLVRNNRWYRDDELEVPHELAKQWLEERAARKERNRNDPREILEPLCDYARPLTLWQAANGLAWLSRREIAPTPKQWTALFANEIRTGPPSFFMDSQTLMQFYDTVKFLNSLAPEARTALFEKRLPSDSLTAPQRAALVRLAPELMQEGIETRRLVLGVDWVGTILRAPGIKALFR